MPGTERDVVNEARQPGPSRGSQFDHSGAGFLNVNEGPGVQKNLAITGGSHNQQFNAESIHIQHQAPAVRGETPPLPDAFLPFRRDPDYVANEAVNEQLRGRLSAAGARVALVGIGGVG